MNRRILVVDDEPQIRTVLRAYLEAEGFEVATHGTAADALNEVRRTMPDLVLLDIGLPDMSGLDVLAKIRTTSQVYVILVTARTEEVDKLLGLGFGADDYITKPFSPREVVARVKTVLRRMRAADEPTDDGVLRFAGLTIDADRREVLVGGSPVELSALDFDLLTALASAPGRVYSRSQLLEKVWGYDFYGDERVVDVHIKNMRGALGDDATAPRIIGTIRGIGYKFLLAPEPS